MRHYNPRDEKVTGEDAVSAGITSFSIALPVMPLVRFT